jgi:hypothetical protein
MEDTEAAEEAAASLVAAASSGVFSAFDGVMTPRTFCGLCLSALSA